MIHQQIKNRGELHRIHLQVIICRFVVMAEVCTDEALCETRAAGRSSLWYVLICDASKMASITGPHFGTARKPSGDVWTSEIGRAHV